MHAAAFQRLLKSRDINFFISENHNIKCAMVERFRQTLQGKIHCCVTANRRQRFVDVLPALLRTYNTIHDSTISMATQAVNWAYAECVWEQLYSLQRPQPVVGLGHLHLSPGDRVRVSRIQHQFTKGNNNHWPKEIFHMETMQDTSPVTYMKADAAGEPINGTSCGQELQRFTPLDDFEVETILDTHRPVPD